METAALAGPTLSASETLSEMRRRGYSLSPVTRVEVTSHKVGPQAITYADKLSVKGSEAPPDDLRRAMKTHKTELLAAACVMDPPVGWLVVLVRRYLEGSASPAMLAANVAGFLGLHPGHEGPGLEPIIEEALR